MIRQPLTTTTHSFWEHLRHKMPLNIRLSGTEKETIEAHKAHNLSCTEIGKAIGWHKTTEYKSLKQMMTRKHLKKMGGPIL